MRFDEDKAAFLTAEMEQFMRQVARCAFDAGCLNLSFLDHWREKSGRAFIL